LFTAAKSSKKKHKSLADAPKCALRTGKEKEGNAVLKAQKSVAYQLNSYCMGMNQLTGRSKMRDDTISLE
jgi:hypothetical protein